MTSLLRWLIVMLVVTTVAPVGAGQLTPVRFATNWLAEPEHGGFYQALASGEYAACGLDVTIVPGGPQVNNRALLIAGKVDFHMGLDILQAFSAIEQDIPLRVVAAAFQKDPIVLMSHPGQGLERWQDLRSAKRYFIADIAMHGFFKWLVNAHGFDPERRAVYGFNPAPFIADAKSLQQGFVTSEPLAVERAGGFRPNVFLLADHGYGGYSTTIEVMQETIDRRPQVVRCFVDASARGWYGYLYGDNSQANALIRKHNPDLDEAQIRYSVEKMKAYGIVDSGDALTLGIGALNAKRVADFYQEMVAAGAITGGLDVTRAYTLQFTNKGVGMDLKRR